MVHLADMDPSEGLDGAFGLVDEGYFNVMGVAVDGVHYDWIQAYSGDTEIGVVFAEDSTVLVAEVGDGDLLGCVAGE